MAAITPSYVMDLERRMRIITTNEYKNLNSKVWWRSVAREIPATGAAERLIWFLDTAKIERVNKLGGEIEFEDMLAITTEYEMEAAAKGLKLNKYKFEDTDGGGLNAASHWSKGIGAYAAYWPQKLIGGLVRTGGAASSLAYDGQIFFSGAHPLNPYDSSVGTFANDLTGAASGSFPGAVPIDASVSLDVALTNLGKAIAYIQGSIKMPNGEDPRNLKIRSIMGPSTLVPRMQQLTNAKYIAQAATGGAGSGDIESVVRNWGLGDPIEAPELGAAYTSGSDTSYYLIAEDATSSDLPAFGYYNREAFSVAYYGELADPQLRRMNELEWTIKGRNAAVYGHPFLIFRCRST
jgi:hypothetical protein